MINIAIRATYYIFCCRNRNWDSPDLMQFWFLFFSFLFYCFCFVLFLWIIQSQAAFVNCLYVARFTIVHSKTQIKFPLSLLLSLLSQSLPVFFLCISRAQTMHLEHQSLKSIILFIPQALFWGFVQIPACRSFGSLYTFTGICLCLVIAEHDFSVFLSCSLSGASSVCAIIIIIIIIN